MALGDALKALRAEVWTEIEEAQNRMDTTEGEANERAKFERDFLMRIQNRLIEVTEANARELRQATEESSLRTGELLSQTDLINTATARMQSLEQEREQMLKVTDRAVAAAKDAAESIEKVNANWQKRIELEAEVIANPLDDKAKRKRDAFIQRKFYEQLRRN